MKSTPRENTSHISAIESGPPQRKPGYIWPSPLPDKESIQQAAKDAAIPDCFLTSHRVQVMEQILLHLDVLALLERNAGRSDIPIMNRKKQFMGDLGIHVRT